MMHKEIFINFFLCTLHKSRNGFGVQLT